MRNTVKLNHHRFFLYNSMRNFSTRVKYIVVDDYKLHESMKILQKYGYTFTHTLVYNAQIILTT